MKRFFSLLFLFGFSLLMLLFSKETLLGASRGLLLWFQTLLPTLLPFIIISNLLIRTGAASYISHAVSPLIKRVFCVSEPACYAVLVGFLCGYPMGAKVIADLLKAGQITYSEAKYLLSFCNNTSPMFIISFLVMQNFNNESLVLGTLGILFLAPILCSFLFRRIYKIQATASLPAAPSHKEFMFHFDLLDTSIMNGFETITKVGGYIILFSILLTLCQNIAISVPLLPLLEISNGIPMIVHSEMPLTFTYPLALALTAFGGFCAVAQTASMLQGTRISIIPYIIQKLITATVTSLLAIIYILFIHR